MSIRIRRAIRLSFAHPLPLARPRPEARAYTEPAAPVAAGQRAHTPVSVAVPPAAAETGHDDQPPAPCAAPLPDTPEAARFEAWWDTRPARAEPHWPLTHAALSNPTACGQWNCVCCRFWLAREDANRQLVARLEGELVALRGPLPAAWTNANPFGTPPDTTQGEDTHAAHPAQPALRAL